MKSCLSTIEEHLEGGARSSAGAREEETRDGLLWARGAGGTSNERLGERGTIFEGIL